MAIPWFYIFLASYVVWVVLACATLLLERRSPTATLAWIFAFIAIPVLSGLYYMVFGPRRLTRKRRRYEKARHALRRASRGEAPPRPELARDAAALAAVGKRLEQGEPTFATAVHLLDDGDACMKSLDEAIAAARHHVHMEYYIWEPDQVGTHFRDVLAEAARRGVEVRVIYDDVGSPHVSRAFWAPLRAAGGEVRAFNRVRLNMSSIHFANFRTHRKIAIVDGLVGFLGGINMHDPASATRSGKDAWRDEHVRIEGEPVHRIQRLFLESWNYCGGAFRLTAGNVERYFPAAAAGKGVPVQILDSGPDDTNAPMHAYFLAALSTARTRVLIETPYLIPDEPLETALRIAELRGVDVQVIVPRRGDSWLVTAASRTYCESLRKAGIKVYEYGPPMLHAKTMVIDDTVAIVGTANLDNRSFRLNFEIAGAFYDQAFIDKLVARFEADRHASRAFGTKRKPEKLQVLLESIARLTSPVL
ncbi:MAG TPA: cardiolipin synthase [Usitatibacter sp.]|jgi:cardiolipin synthase|nr:cardiolipin synthase [Usitatibacter sp.]